LNAINILETPIPEMVKALSVQELKILNLIARGLSNKEISQQLFLSVGTVKWHSSNIYGKLVVKNRTEAMTTAHKLGLLL